MYCCTKRGKFFFLCSPYNRHPFAQKSDWSAHVGCISACTFFFIFSRKYRGMAATCHTDSDQLYHSCSIVSPCTATHVEPSTFGQNSAFPNFYTLTKVLRILGWTWVLCRKKSKFIVALKSNNKELLFQDAYRRMLSLPADELNYLVKARSYWTPYENGLCSQYMN